MNPFRIHTPGLRWWRLSALAGAVAAMMLAGGCSGYAAYRDGRARIAEGETEQGLARLREAMDADPGNGDYRRSYFTQRESAVNGLLHEAELATSMGDFATARRKLDQVARLDPANAREKFDFRQAGKQRLNQGLHRHERAVAGKRVAPGFEVMRERQMPGNTLRRFRRFVFVITEANNGFRGA